MKRFFLWFLLGIIFVLGFILRFGTFAHGDFYYLLDPSRDLLIVKSMVIDHKLTLIGGRTGIGGLFHGPVWLYMLIPTFLLSHGAPYMTLIPVYLILAMAIVVASFFVARSLYGNLVGLTVALGVSFSSSYIYEVPFTSNAHVLPLVFLLYIYALFRFVRGSQWYFALVLFAIGLSFQFESAFAVVLFPLTIVALLLWRTLPKWKPVFVGSIGALFALATFILFDVRHQFLMTSVLLQTLLHPMKPLPGYERYANILFRVGDRWHMLWENIFSPLYDPNAVIGRMLVLMLLAIGILFLIYRVWVRKYTEQDKEFLYFLLIPCIVFGTYVFYALPLWGHYLLPLVIVSILSIALACTYVYKALVGKIFLGVCCIVLIFMPLFDIFTHLSRLTVKVGDGSYLVQDRIANWIYTDAAGKPAGYFIYVQGNLTYNMDYLMWWEGYRRSITPIDNTKHASTYLIYYPAPVGDLRAQEIWKQAIIHTHAPVILTKDFPGGLRVEKVQMDLSHEEAPDPNYYQNLIFR